MEKHTHTFISFDASISIREKRLAHMAVGPETQKAADAAVEKAKDLEKKLALDPSDAVEGMVRDVHNELHIVEGRADVDAALQAVLRGRKDALRLAKEKRETEKNEFAEEKKRSAERFDQLKKEKADRNIQWTPWIANVNEEVQKQFEVVSTQISTPAHNAREREQFALKQIKALAELGADLPGAFEGRVLKPSGRNDWAETFETEKVFDDYYDGNNDTDLNRTRVSFKKLHDDHEKAKAYTVGPVREREVAKAVDALKKGKEQAVKEITAGIAYVAALEVGVNMPKEGYKKIQALRDQLKKISDFADTLLGSPVAPPTGPGAGPGAGPTGPEREPRIALDSSELAAADRLKTAIRDRNAGERDRALEALTAEATRKGHNDEMRDKMAVALSDVVGQKVVVDRTTKKFVLAEERQPLVAPAPATPGRPPETLTETEKAKIAELNRAIVAKDEKKQREILDALQREMKGDDTEKAATITRYLESLGQKDKKVDNNIMAGKLEVVDRVRTEPLRAEDIKSLKDLFEYFFQKLVAFLEGRTAISGRPGETPVQQNVQKLRDQLKAAEIKGIELQHELAKAGANVFEIQQKIQQNIFEQNQLRYQIALAEQTNQIYQAVGPYNPYLHVNAGPNGQVFIQQNPWHSGMINVPYGPHGQFIPGVPHYGQVPQGVYNSHMAHLMCHEVPMCCAPIKRCTVRPPAAENFSRNSYVSITIKDSPYATVNLGSPGARGHTIEGPGPARIGPAPLPDRRGGYPDTRFRRHGQM